MERKKEREMKEKDKDNKGDAGEISAFHWWDFILICLATKGFVINCSLEKPFAPGRHW